MSWVDGLSPLLAQYGLVAVFGCVFFEAMGVPLPGETILILAAGYAGHSGGLPIGAVLAAAAAAAVLGDNAGYLVGRYGGWPLLRRFRRVLHVRQTQLKVGRYLFARRGGAVVFAGRFVSVLRAYAAFLAGVNHMRWRRFVAYNCAGGLVWATLWSLGPYFLGSALQRVSGPAQLAVVGVAVAALVAAVIAVRRQWRRLSMAAEAAYPGPLR